MNSRERGFTLLEVMIALAVFATLAAAVLSASQYVLKQRSGLQERVLATWIGDNHLTELRLRRDVTVGEQRHVVRMDSRDWHVRQQISAPRDPVLLRVDLFVSLAGSEYPLYQTRGWMAARHE
ncbi:type II secretion system minor pseudopilin GspI [Pseudomonas yamanorum]|uniref:Type II secretion system protein I n=1 Tax=Pseudomonas yamanorum TaxID=515393 RepID=A0A7Y8EM94_9PSED|nr:type II secretion system minor pseudopilin GspI [Pseudomonas yamanorum]NWE17286.1 type II secretion system minor pseudopilin GspI [Pseudomonas yamanorum]